MKQSIIDELANKKVLILGFGKEGRSTYNFIKNNNVNCKLGIVDKNDITDNEIISNKDITLYIGDNYEDIVNEYNVVLKSPGISFKGKNFFDEENKITSQTELFLKYGSKKTVGITGTKGKSTTATLTYEILKNKYKVMLVGNIGIPVFDAIDKFDETDIFVFELSSHQLEHVKYSPHIAVILNIFEEHLDHYNSYEEYKEAKRNIFKYQKETDYYILNNEMKEIILGKYELISNTINVIDKEIELPINLFGKHNLFNINVAKTIANIYEVDEKDVVNAIKEFKGLPHRLEYIGTYNDIRFIDDSIATIPEAVISAIESVDNVDTIILGGMDRGIDYSHLIKYINDGNINNVILMYDSGKKIYSELDRNNSKCRIILVNDLEEAVKMAYKYTKKNSTCILSPAAASYGVFKNFEQRGDKFKEFVIKYSK